MAKHMMKMSMWKSAADLYYVADTEDLAHHAWEWWHVPRLLDMDVCDYIKWMLDEWDAELYVYSKEKNLVFFRWKDEQKAHKYQLYINKMSRQKKFMIGRDN